MTEAAGATDKQGRDGHRDALALMGSSRRMIAVRSVLMAVGLIAGAYGAQLLWEFPVDVLIRIAVWAAVGLLVHDFVFAPLTAVVGSTSRRFIKGRWWAPATIAAVCSVTLTLLAVPVFDTPGAKPDNPSAIDRDYPIGLIFSLAVVWACVPVYYAVVLLLRRLQRATATPTSVERTNDRLES